MHNAHSKELHRCHRSVMCLLHGFAIACLPVTIAYVIIFALHRADLLPGRVHLSSVSFGYRIICALIGLEYLRKYFDDLYVFGNKRIIHFRGRLSFRYRRTSIAYRDIREIKVRQSIMGRVLDYGTLKLGTASTHDYEIECEDIAHPTKLSRFIEDLIQSNRKRTPKRHSSERPKPVVAH